MQLSRHTDYSLRMLLFLGVREETPATIQEVADCFGLSAHHMAKVAQTLIGLKYVKSIRGRSGGLVLGQAADEINIGKLVRETENKIEMAECFSNSNHCPIEPACKLKSVLHEAQYAFFSKLSQYTLADLLRRRRSELVQLMNRRDVGPV